MEMAYPSWSGSLTAFFVVSEQASASNRRANFILQADCLTDVLFLGLLACSLQPHLQRHFFIPGMLSLERMKSVTAMEMR